MRGDRGPYKPKTCQACNRVYTPTGSRQRWCDTCQRKWEAERTPKPERIFEPKLCADCGQPFMPRASGAKWCSFCRQGKVQASRRVDANKFTPWACCIDFSPWGGIVAKVIGEVIQDDEPCYSVEFPNVVENGRPVVHHFPVGVVERL